MTKDPWTDSDPQPGDFDEYLQSLDPSLVEVHDADPTRSVRIVLSIDGEDAERRGRISAARGEKPSELISELLRAADRSAA